MDKNIVANRLLKMAGDLLAAEEKKLPDAEAVKETNKQLKDLGKTMKKVLGADDDPQAALVKFLAQNPNPADDAFHKWAENSGIEVEKAEAAAYRLASMMADFLTNGKSVKEKVTEQDVDAEELKAGIKVEKEHVNDEAVARRIALDHLAEFPKNPLGYYVGLALLEKLLKSMQGQDADAAKQKIEAFRKLAEG